MILTRILQEWSLGCILIFSPSPGTSWPGFPQFESPSALLPMLLLGWLTKPRLKHPAAFLVQSTKDFPIPPTNIRVRAVTKIPQSLVPTSVRSLWGPLLFKPLYRGKGLFGLQIIVHHQEKPRQELEAGTEGRDWTKDHGELCLLISSPWRAYPFFFLLT